MSGSAGAGEDYRQSWRGVAALDVQTNGGAADGKAENERGQAGATGVRQTAQSQAAAIAPATGSPAGVKLLVSSMDERLAAMQREIETTKAQNRLLATRLRQIAAAYRNAAATAPMGGGSALGGMGGAWAAWAASAVGCPTWGAGRRSDERDVVTYPRRWGGPPTCGADGFVRAGRTGQRGGCPGGGVREDQTRSALRVGCGRAPRLRLSWLGDGCLRACRDLAASSHL